CSLRPVKLKLRSTGFYAKRQEVVRQGQARLEKLLCFVRYRIAKLDQERRYTRYYCRVLAPFNRTEVTVNFALRGERLRYSIEFSLDDLVVPGEDIDSAASASRTRFGEAESILSRVEEALKAVEDQHDS
ncbi:hypothetical protein, partial [Posidoniimonas polymericola]|uniref:hypothetical protein n=1 Tax=Posidoniimonas polymericola TaxID=2528002 RepID=UPI001E2F4501